MSHSDVRGHAAPRRTGLAGRILGWIETARERDRLLELDDRTLRDIGLTREAAAEEAMRPFWDVPARRR